MLKKLLVAIDGTEYSWRALEYAIGIAKMAESELVVLTVARDGLQHTPQLPLEGELAGDVNGPAMQIGNEVLGAAKHIRAGHSLLLCAGYRQPPCAGNH